MIVDALGSLPEFIKGKFLQTPKSLRHTAYLTFYLHLYIQIET